MDVELCVYKIKSLSTPQKGRRAAFRLTPAGGEGEAKGARDHHPPFSGRKMICRVAQTTLSETVPARETQQYRAAAAGIAGISRRVHD